MKPVIKKTIGINSVLFLLLLFSGCAKKDGMDNADSAGKASGSSREILRSDQTIRFNLTGRPSSFDPVYASSIDEFNIAIQLFEGLLSHNPRDLKPVSASAERYDVSSDGLVYTFYLRDNLRWSDGVEITSRTFYDSWIRALSASTGAEYNYMMHYIKNAKSFTEGRAGASKVGIKVIDKKTLSITLESPVS